VFNLTDRANFGSNYDVNVRNATFREPIGFITPSGVIIPRSLSAEIAAQFVF
jgi:hypothetical protein